MIAGVECFRADGCHQAAVARTARKMMRGAGLIPIYDVY
ncbi:hypothetical protein K788_0007582 [Paraburkholderia caribensis MBA4]|uniref:Uncharacterized protein n=1 Tax=Paraburkholderia caribensis MBA4 TaxID=1323664 RepID=A0A0P0RK98_9BURK|nr:hypothetical protein K788_0007582 [Paraburkholderia caribensis MBA4]